jgi:hypothetical protein
MDKKRSFEMISAISIVTLFFIIGIGHAMSVDVGGWTFTADLGDQWQTNTNTAENDEVSGWESRNVDYLIEHNIDSDDPAFYNWKGICLWNSFWLPQENADVDQQNIPDALSPTTDSILANVDIQVHEIPREVQDWDFKDIVNDLLGPSGSANLKEIEFEGHPAILIEEHFDDTFNDDGEKIISAGNASEISVLMTEDTVVTIDVTAREESGIHPWDVIEKFRISKK